MRKFAHFACAALLLTLSAYAAPQNPPEEKKAPAPRVLKVKLAYNGAGTVDDNHKIIVFLFDSPDFAQGGVMPIGGQAGAAKNATVTFSDVSASPVYVVTVFDPKGEYDGQSGPPPSGSSLGVYTKTPPKPEPVVIDPGKTVEIELPFDDSFKMP
jgi:hypothetical protein